MASRMNAAWYTEQFGDLGFDSACDSEVSKAAEDDGSKAPGMFAFVSEYCCSLLLISIPSTSGSSSCHLFLT